MLKKISYCLILLFLVSLPFDHFYSEAILIALVAHTMLVAGKEDWKKWGDKKVLALQAIYGVTLVATLYSPYKDLAFGDWFQQLPLLLFPWICAVLAPMLVEKRDRLLDAFTLCCAGTILYLYGDAFRTMLFYHWPLSSLFGPNFTNQLFSLPLDLHATYLSLYVALCLFYCVLRVLETDSVKRISYSLAAAVLGAGLIQLSVKSAILATAIVLIFAFPYVQWSGWRRLRAMTASAVTCVLLGVLLLNGSFFHKRMIDDLQTDISVVQQGASEPRLLRWEAAWTLIKGAPVVGYGSGSEKTLLRESYYQRGLFRSYLLSLDAHNQFLSWWLRAGLLGLLVYAGLLGWGFRSAFLQKDVLWIGFLALVTAASLGEDVLAVQHGLFFISFFFAFFFFTMKPSNSYTIKHG